MERKILVSSTIWDLFLEDPRESLLLIYYCTNHYGNLLGAYHLPIRRIISDLGYSKGEVEELNLKLQKKGHIVYFKDLDYIFCPYILIWNNLNNSKIIKGLKNIYNKLPDEVKLYILENEKACKELDKIISLDDSSMSYQEYNINSNSNSNLNINSNSNLNANNDADASVDEEMKKDIDLDMKRAERVKYEEMTEDLTGCDLAKKLIAEKWDLYGDEKEKIKIKLLDLGIEKGQAVQALENLGLDRVATALEYAVEQGKSNPCALFKKVISNYQLVTKKSKISCPVCGGRGIEEISIKSLEQGKDLHFTQLKNTTLACPICSDPTDLKNYKKFLTSNQLISIYDHYKNLYGGSKWIDCL